MVSPPILIALALLVISSITFISIIYLLPSDVDDQEEKSGHQRPRIQVLVLGDIGRSPRMQYHALSISKHGGIVDLIGYDDSELHPDVVSQPSITVHAIARTPDALKTSSRTMFLLLGPLKVLHQIFSLWIILSRRTKPAKILLVQHWMKHFVNMKLVYKLRSLENPPSIPTLLLAQLICQLRNTRLIIDWHNLGYTILALRLGSSHPLVYVARWYEKRFSSSAHAHFTVTNAMRQVLKQDFHIKSPILTLHDRPASHFKPFEATQRLGFLGCLPETAAWINEIRSGKLKVIVSSTSWTPDEDFSILLNALVGYSQLATSSHPQLPELGVIITGKGPQKDDYISRIADLKAQGKLEMVQIKTTWLSTAHYSGLLASADLGVSLHTSSSGVDLPMKVVDMFGAGLPVIGWGKFAAWPELVQEGVNGRGISSAQELQNVLVDLLGGNGQELSKLRKGAVEEGRRGWNEEWKATAGKLLELC